MSKTGPDSGSKPPRSTSLLRRTLVALAAALVLASLFGWHRYRARSTHLYTPPGGPFTPERTRAALSRGEHLARGLAGCAECHGPDFGGRVFAETPLFRVVAPNLTSGRGGVTRELTARDWSNAIVHGVGPDRRSLILMPAKDLGALADQDVAAIVAFLQSVPAVDRSPGATRVTPLGKIVIGLLGLPLFSAEDVDPEARPEAVPEVAPTRDYGRYLLNVCRGCHGPDLRGGVVIHPGAPPSSDLSRAVSGWEFASFERALREGRGRDGRVLDESMPWRSLKRMSDDELRALWLALRQE